jgi:hypothetical protein
MPMIAAVHLRNSDSRAHAVGIHRRYVENFMDAISRHVGRPAYLLAVARERVRRDVA